MCTVHVCALAQALRRAPDIEEMTKSSDGPEWGEDVAPEMLADADSKFVEIGGLRVGGPGPQLLVVCLPALLRFWQQLLPHQIISLILREVIHVSSLSLATNSCPPCVFMLTLTHPHRCPPRLCVYQTLPRTCTALRRAHDTPILPLYVHHITLPLCKGSGLTPLRALRDVRRFTTRRPCLCSSPTRAAAAALAVATAAAPAAAAKAALQAAPPLAAARASS